MKIQDLKKFLFIDIETVRSHKEWSNVPERAQNNWAVKSSYINSDLTPEETFVNSAGIYAEFGKIVCISVGYFRIEEDQILEFRTKSFYGDDERTLLIQFNDLLKIKYKNRAVRFCAHNGKEFDYPYLCRRMIINDVKLPPSLELSGKKPWEVLHEDTLQMWKFGDFKHYTSLELLASVLNIPSSKDELTGSMVSETYYKENDIERIKNYCEKDIWVLAQIYLKIKQIEGVQNLEQINVIKT